MVVHYGVVAEVTHVDALDHGCRVDRDVAVFIPRGWNHGVDDYSAKAV